MDLLQDRKTNYLLFGGAAGGAKTYLGCLWLYGQCAKYPDVHYFVGREELKRLKESTVISFYKMMREFELFQPKFNGQDNYFMFPNNSRISLLDLKYLPSDPLYERYGSIEYTGGWIEEGGEVHFGAFDTLKTRIGRYNNDKYGITKKLLVTGNPKKNWMYNVFYKPSVNNTLPENTAFVQAFVSDNPEIEIDYVNGLHNITDQTMKERLLYGNWEYDTSDGSLISYDKITDLFTNTFVEPGIKCITADIARFGSDKTVIGLWNGLRCEEIVTIDKSSIPDSCDAINKMRLKNSIGMSGIIVDESGVGGGVVDVLGCVGFVGNAKPIPTMAGKQNFNHLKSQCYFKLAELINNSKIFVNCNQDIKTKLTEELEIIKSDTIDSDGKMAVIPKDKMKDLLGRSPDYADMLMMRMYFDLSVRNYF